MGKRIASRIRALARKEVKRLAKKYGVPPLDVEVWRYDYPFEAMYHPSWNVMVLDPEKFEALVEGDVERIRELWDEDDFEWVMQDAGRPLEELVRDAVEHEFKHYLEEKFPELGVKAEHPPVRRGRGRRRA